MLVRVQEDRCGNITLEPVAEKWQRRFAAHMKRVGQAADASVFLQEGMGAGSFLETLTPGQRRHVSGGWTLRLRMDPWGYGQLLGYDACECV